jgi:hypothetical protein
MISVFMVALNVENRMAAKVKGGRKIEVIIELNTEERTVMLPVEFQKLQKHEYLQGIRHPYNGKPVI